MTFLIIPVKRLTVCILAQTEDGENEQPLRKKMKLNISTETKSSENQSPIAFQLNIPAHPIQHGTMTTNPATTINLVSKVRTPLHSLNPETQSPLQPPLPHSEKLNTISGAKPNYTYTDLITLALKDKTSLTVSGIYQWIT